ncbi:MAG: DUF1302 family protein [Pseudomonadota bacterium]
MRYGAVVIALSLGTASAYADLEASLATELTVGYGDTLNESVQQAFELVPMVTAELSPDSDAVVSLRVRLDPANRVESGKAPIATYGTGSQSAVLGELGTVEVRDAYLEHRWKRGLFRLGKQQIVWGRLDGLKVLDVVNPMDFREFVLDDFADSRISLWSAYIDTTIGNWRAELAVIPDATGHAIPVADSWFNLAAPRFRFGAESTGPLPRIETQRTNGVASGVRLSRRVKSFDVAALAYTGLDHEPLGRLVPTPTAPILEQFYERRDVYGLSIEGATGSIAYRVELSRQPNRTFNTRSAAGLAATELDQVVIGAGVDIDGPLGTFINIQHMQDRVQQAPADLVRPATDRITTVFVRRQFAYETFGITARWYYSHKLGDQMGAITMEYALSDATRLSFGINRFQGNRAGLFGQFADRDRITVRLSHAF